MTEERTRRRRRRGPRQADTGTRIERETRTTARTAQRTAQPGEWQWSTFPVFAAFVGGAFLILLIGPTPATDPFRVLFFLFLGLALFCLIHITVRWYLRRRGRVREEGREGR